MKKPAQYFPTPYGRTPKNISNIMITLDNLLETSETLSILKLENLPITIEDAEQLAHVSFCYNNILSACTFIKFINVRIIYLLL